MTAASAGDRALLAAFEAGTLSLGAFSHREHVRVAWLLLTSGAPFEEAAPRFCRALRRHVTQLGQAERYHETITWAFLALVNERRHVRRAGDFERFVADNPDLLSPDVLLQVYDPETLGSERARRAFVLPRDRRAPRRERAARASRGPRGARSSTRHAAAVALNPRPRPRGACGAGQLGVVKVLLAAGADPNIAPPQNGITPLVAVSSEPARAELLGALVRAGAAASLASKYGMTPLHWAADTGDLDALAVLLEAGADPDARVEGLGRLPKPRSSGSRSKPHPVCLTGTAR